MPILAFFAYVILIITASGTLRRASAETLDGRYLDRRSAVAWAFALASTFCLPWSGVPLSWYFGVGSWAWFLCAGTSLGLIRGDERAFCQERRCFAIGNAGAIAAAIYAFMNVTGVPGDMPDIEGIAAINSLEGLQGYELTCARILFLLSGVLSFISVYSPRERDSVLLSFSYSSFLVLAFMPPARIFFGLRPRAALLVDAAAYFVEAELLHVFVMGYMSKLMASRWKYPYVIINSALTCAGIYFLFSSL